MLNVPIEIISFQNKTKFFADCRRNGEKMYHESRTLQFYNILDFSHECLDSVEKIFVVNTSRKNFIFQLAAELGGDPYNEQNIRINSLIDERNPNVRMLRKALGYVRKIELTLFSLNVT